MEHLREMLLLITVIVLGTILYTTLGISLTSCLIVTTSSLGLIAVHECLVKEFEGYDPLIPIAIIWFVTLCMPLVLYYDPDGITNVCRGLEEAGKYLRR
jgi:hypothetical protein